MSDPIEPGASSPVPPLSPLSSPPSSPGPTLLIEAETVHTAYRLGTRRLEVLRGVSLSVARGEFVALRGASGAGKSTLLHLLGGLDTPDVGRVSFLGKDLAGGLNLNAFRNRQVGFVFQAYHLLPELDALENVCLPS